MTNTTACAESLTSPTFTAPPAHLTAREVQRHRRDPRREAVDAVATLEPLPCPSERFLHRVLGGGDAAAHERDRAHHLPVLALHECADRVVVHVSSNGSRAHRGRYRECDQRCGCGERGGDHRFSCWKRCCFQVFDARVGVAVAWIS